ncbi:sulfite exporter TauE/SafE family protein [Mesorhizobium sp. VNQ89]|uniref:HoxN/HupN/NixA family nickel/cobalt transporter n=1 Tax=Mesorhizobium quangtriensis TaxID=3157709 RepID=UPI0032B826B3
MGLLQELVAIQREIYLAFAARIGNFAETGDWQLLAAYLPMGIVFGAVHALTPGHSKAVLATYLTGSTATLPRALVVSLALSFTHVTMSVLIALFSLPLVSVALGSVGRAPLLEDLSRGVLGLIGLWMLWQAFRGTAHSHGREGSLVGFMAGLIPCPLTLFVMTFAISRGVPQAGVAFAAVMMIGVVLVLSVVALAAVLFRQQLLRLLAARPRMVDAATRTIQVTAGLILVTVAWNAIAG